MVTSIAGSKPHRCLAPREAVAGVRFSRILVDPARFQELLDLEFLPDAAFFLAITPLYQLLGAHDPRPAAFADEPAAFAFLEGRDEHRAPALVTFCVVAGRVVFRRWPVAVAGHEATPSVVGHSTTVAEAGGDFIPARGGVHPLSPPKSHSPQCPRGEPEAGFPGQLHPSAGEGFPPVALPGELAAPSRPRISDRVIDACAKALGLDWGTARRRVISREELRKRLAEDRARRSRGWKPETLA